MIQLRRSTDFSINHWRVITKVFIIANALVWALLMGWVPVSLTYKVAHIHEAGIVPTVALCVAIVVLMLDFLLFEHKRPRQLSWLAHKMPLGYMLLGGGYLIFAYMCSYVDGAGILLFNALIQAAMAGWVAYLTKKDLYAA